MQATAMLVSEDNFFFPDTALSHAFTRMVAKHKPVSAGVDIGLLSRTARPDTGL